MPRFFSCSTIAACSLSALLTGGCADSSPPADSSAAPAAAETAHDDHGDHEGHDDHDGHDHDGHDHPSEGPHHGALIELGGDEYHAEFVHDEEASTVSIYILDSTAKDAVAIDATEIAINLRHDGKGEQFKLSASPDKGDPEGKSSRFVSDNEELVNDLHDEDAEASLVLKINGKSFRGTIPHDHDHGDHDHSHGDHSHND